MKQFELVKKRIGAIVCTKGLVRLLAMGLLGSLSMETAAQRSEILSPRIASLQVVAGDNWQSMPVVELNGQSILIAFDDLTHEYHRYTYKIEHCDADWKVSSDLFAGDYISGFNGELTIDDYDESLNTNQLYTHYRLRLPNSNCRISMSGNYQLTVFDEDNDSQPVLTARFMVVELKVNIALGYRHRCQQESSAGEVLLAIRRLARHRPDVPVEDRRAAKWQMGQCGLEREA